MANPSPTSAFKPPTPQEAQADNDRRLRECRKHFGFIPIRVIPQIKTNSDDVLPWRGAGRRRKISQGWNNWGLIRGGIIKVRFDEAIDVYDFLRDLRRFLVAWRPERARTAANLEAARGCLDTWEKLGG